MEARASSAANAFIGRERERNALRGRLAEAVAGRGSVVLLVGEPGIGKTRLARESASEADRAGALVLWGRGFEGEWPRPYGPWVEALGRYARGLGLERLRDLLGPGAPLLTQLVPGLPASPPDGPSATSGGQQERYRLYDAVATLLLDAARERPVVLVLDDLHWADRDSLALLRYTAAMVGQARLLLIGAYRDAELDEGHPLRDVLADLAREGDYERQTIRGLDELEVARYLAAAIGRELPPDLVRRIHAETEGNPFYIREVLRHLVETGRLAGRDERGSAALNIEDLGVSEDVRHVVHRRLSRLSAETGTILRVAAAFPRGVDVRALRALLDRSEDELLDALDEAVRAGLVRAVVGRPGLYRFAHAIVRHAVYDELGAGQRARLHRQIGEAFERLYGVGAEAHLDELAYHFCRAVPGGDPDVAFDYATRAAERAMRLLAHEDAAEHYGRALQMFELHEAPADEPGRAEREGRRYELLMALGDAQAKAGDWLSAQRSYQEAAAAARALRTSIGADEAAAMLARAAVGLPGAVVEAGVVDWALVGLLEEALAVLGDEDSRPRARALARLAAELYFTDAPERRAALSREALAVARRVGDPATLAYVLEASHLALWGPENVEERLAITAELSRLADELRDPDLTLLGHAWRIPDLLERGDIRAADAEIAEHARLARELRRPFHLWNVAMWGAMRALLDGRFADAQARSGEMLAIMRQIRDPDGEMFFALQAMTLWREQGRLDQLGELAAAFQGHAERLPSVPLIRCLLADLYAELGRVAEARAELERLAADDFASLPRDLAWLASLALLADACSTLGDARPAATLYGLLLPYAARITYFGHGLACWGSTSRPLGRLAATLGRHEEAVRHFEDAVARHAEMGARPLLARTRYEYAEVLLARGDPCERARALELLDRALDAARELGMAGLAERAEGLRQAAGRTQRPAPSGASMPNRARADEPEVPAEAQPLTRREREVAALLARGLSNREIAEALVIGERTAEMHVSNILGKLGLASRTQVAVWAAERGLAISPPG